MSGLQTRGCAAPAARPQSREVTRTRYRRHASSEAVAYRNTQSGIVWMLALLRR